MKKNNNKYMKFNVWFSLNLLQNLFSRIHQELTFQIRQVFWSKREFTCTPEWQVGALE